MANLNPTFRKELNGKRFVVDFEETFRLTPYELNQIRFWLNRSNDHRYQLPTILPISKRFALDFISSNDVLLIRFKKSLFTW